MGSFQYRRLWISPILWKTGQFRWIHFSQTEDSIPSETHRTNCPALSADYPLLCLKYSTWRSRLAASRSFYMARPDSYPFLKDFVSAFHFLITFASCNILHCLPNKLRSNAVIPVAEANKNLKPD